MKKLPVLLLAVALCPALLNAESPPWKAIYSNDTTNVFNCQSPFNPEGDDTRFTEEMLRASVAEAAVPGMGAQLLQPGHGWIPWWDSKLLPLKEHEQWFRDTFKVEPAIAVHKYLLNGGDLIGPFIDECHKHGNAALISYRVNDNHHLEWVVKGNPPAYSAHAINKFYVDHPEYRIKQPTEKDATLAKYRVHNWLFKEARQYKLDLIQEMLDSYPTLDGMELDFMRYPNYFPEGTPKEKRVQAMVEFISAMRGKLDALAKKTDGKHRYLGARVPIHENDWENIGLDPKAWAKAGIEFFNLSPSYRMVQDMSVAALRKAAPKAKIYVELTHTVQTWKFGGPGYDDHCWRRCTKEMFDTTARIAYAQGADGVSFFNFVYYRAHGGYWSRKGPFNEPPFNYIPELTDKKELEDAPGYFYLMANHELFGAKGMERSYQMDNIVPAKGNGEGLVRIQMITDAESKNSEVEPADALDRGQWSVTLNGKKLASAKPLETAYPFPTPFKAGFGYPEQYITFKLPAGLLKQDNQIVIKNENAPALRLRWIEIVQPAVVK